ncbi:hypothetical protein IIA15_02155 [candidate division TA06 bacterium]|nr:hypothetical protein [candidate division TA06 bacterium]
MKYSLLFAISVLLGCTVQTGSKESEDLFRGYLLSPERIDGDLLKQLKMKNYSSIVVDISNLDEKVNMRTIKKEIDREGLKVYYWIGVGRDILAASKHSEWLHRPHKLNFYGNKPVVVYPWVSINNFEVFEYEFKKVNGLVERAGKEGVMGVFLNDIQSAPEGCGCGNALCRMWDNSIGAKISGEEPIFFGENPIAPFRFVQAVEKVYPQLEVIPVIVEECEAGVTVGGVKDPETTLGYGRILCVHPDGVDTYPKLIRTLGSLKKVGLLSLYKVFERDDPAYGPEAAWTGAILERYHSVDPDQKVISILQGWEVTEKEIEAQIEQVLSHGASGYIVAGEEIDQSWTVIEEKKMKGIKI